MIVTESGGERLSLFKSRVNLKEVENEPVDQKRGKQVVLFLRDRDEDIEVIGRGIDSLIVERLEFDFLLFSFQSKKRQRGFGGLPYLRVP